MKAVALACAAAALHCVATSAMAEAQTFVPPAGEYKVVELVLKNAGHGGGLEAGGILIGKDTYLRGAFRDGKLKIPSRLSVRDITSTLAVDAATIKGEAIIQGHPRTFNELRCTIDATIDAGRITGTWEKTDKSSKGAVTGWVKTEAELQKQNAFATQAAWPCWSGPTTSFAAASTNTPLLEDFSKATLVWHSEDLVPHGNGNAQNYTPLTLKDRTMGGGASAVVADGKVFVFYYQPSGTEYMKAGAGSPLAGDKYVEEECKKEKLTPSPFMSEKFLTKADDVVLCMDAVTGKTLWRTTFAGTGMNQPSHKGGVVNNTPCFAGGKIFARGAGGMLYALDAATGKALWQKPGMSAEGVQPWSGARNQCTAPVYIGDTLVVPNNGNTLFGLDPADGKELWKLPGKSYHFQVPAKWTHDGKEYVVSMTEPPIPKEKGALPVATAICLDPRTGRPLWEVTLEGATNKGVSVFGDVMYATSGGGTGPDKPNPNGKITAWILSLDKAGQLWQTPATHAAGDAPPAANGKYVVVGGPAESHLYDAATGKDLATFKGNGPFNEGYAAFFEDRVVLSLDGSHGHCNMNILGATPETFTKAIEWRQPHPNTTSYHNKFMTFPMVEGRIFFRGYDGVYCYDVRKGR